MAVSMKNLDPAFQGVGQKAGTDIWRIENFRPVPIPKSDYGQFYCGDSYIVLQTTATKSGAYDLHKKTKSLLEEYFSARDTEEAKLCVQELNWPDYYPEFVREAIIFAMERSEHHVQLVGQLLEFLYSENTLSDKDIGAGLMFIAEEFDDTAIDMPLAPRFLGELVGRLSLTGATNFRALRDITVKVEDKANRMTIFDSALHIIKSSSATGSLDAQTDDLIECERLLSEETL